MTKETTACPDCKGRGYTESLSGMHLTCVCVYDALEDQEADGPGPQVSRTKNRRVK